MPSVRCRGNSSEVTCNEPMDGRVYKPVNSNDRKFRELIHTQIAYVTLNFSFVSEGKKVDSIVFSEDEVNNFNKIPALKFSLQVQIEKKSNKGKEKEFLFVREC
ncbi:uncharacterized protein LOC111133389 isoform X2 [Crassostrea virginica]